MYEFYYAKYIKISVYSVDYRLENSVRIMSAEVTVRPLNLSRRKNSERLTQRKNRKVRISLSMSRDLLELIDETKGLAARSAIIEKLLRDQLSIRGNETERK